MLSNLFPYIDAAQLVRARHHPQTIGRCTCIELDLEIEAMNTRIPVGRIPVSDAILVPGDTAAQSCLLHENRIVERYKIITINTCCDCEQVWVAVEQQT